MTRRDAAVLTLVFALALLIGCTAADDASEVLRATTPDPAQPSQAQFEGGPVFHPTDNPTSLGEWGQLAVSDGHLRLKPNVTPYELNSALFSDYAQKLRTVWIDGGASALYREDAVLDFPVGTVITKTFYYSLADELDQLDGLAGAGGHRDRVRPASESAREPADSLDLAGLRLIETRVLVHREDGWHALPYVWNDEQTEATLQRTGDLFELTLAHSKVDAATGIESVSDTSFPYVVPNVNQCAGCHATDHTRGEVMPIGPKTRHLNRTVTYTGTDTHSDTDGEPINQLDAWRSRGLLSGGPAAEHAPRSAAWTDASVSLDARARAYLDINCAHCHNSVGPADTSGLFLEASTELGSGLGICKAPIAAGTGTGGRRYGVVPGNPDESIFIFRLSTTDPASMMPEVGRALTHNEGVNLVSAWIESLDGSCN